MLKKRLLRYYLYIRRGIGHVGVVLSAFTAVNTFYLVSRDWPFFADLSYPLIMGLGVLLLLPVLVGVGFWDYKKGFFEIECSVHTEENPYAKDLFTIKEKQFTLPISLMAAEVSLKVNRELVEKFGLSKEINVSLDRLQQAKDIVEAKLRDS
ncbi:MAG: hypothetical protein WC998_03520 [Candidatus Paceibacterota bacterium]|jgi:hypothetical protein